MSDHRSVPLPPQRTSKRRRLVVSITTTALVVAASCSITPANGFGGVATLTPPSSAATTSSSSYQTLRYAPSTTAASYNFYNLWTPTSPPQEVVGHHEHRPAAASGRTNDDDHMARLSQHLLENSYFTNPETIQLQRTIELIAGGDILLERQVAGFCLLLAETMELGWSALMAAAVHYCTSCNNKHPVAIAGMLDPHVLEIAKNADLLQSLEQHNAAIRSGSDALHIRHLLLTETIDWRALAIRGGAILYQMKQQQTSNIIIDKATARLALRIYAPLSSRLGMHKLKNELEEVAFRLLYPRSYRRVCQSEQLEASMQLVLDQTKTAMIATLQRDDEFMRQVEHFSVTARVKEPYSLWKKMLKNGHEHILQVPDALALRVILQARPETLDEPVELTRGRERALCYYVQELFRQRWRPVSGNPRFKDYIAAPKFNGYQSLHYTATTVDYSSSSIHQQQQHHGGSNNKEWTVEIQIRSHEMHQIAEFGIASHSEYKEQASPTAAAVGGSAGRNSNADPSVEAYLKNLQAWHWQNGHVDTMIVDAITNNNESSLAGRSSSAADHHDNNNNNYGSSTVWQSRERADRLRERTERLQPYLDALTSTKSDLVHKQVVVILNRGASSTVVSLPAGACVLDALRQYDDDDDNNSSSFVVAGSRSSNHAVRVNGQVIPITRQLHNGDVLELSRVSA
jgi:(p)ppGpp synthase/HD superfamily hydrolase